MALDAILLNTQHYKVRIKGSGAILGNEEHPSLYLGVVTIKKEAFGSPSTMVDYGIIYTDILEFEAAKFNLILAFVQLFYQLVETENTNLYNLHYVLKHKI